jgi:hypothetical protein
LRGQARLNLSTLIDQVEHWLLDGTLSQEIAGAWEAVDGSVTNQGTEPQAAAKFFSLF